MNDEKTGSQVHTLLIQGCPGSFTCLSIEHCVQGTLWLYVACDRQDAEFQLMKANFENSWAPHLGFEPRPPVQQAGILTTRPLSCLSDRVLRQSIMKGLKMVNKIFFFPKYGPTYMNKIQYRGTMTMAGLKSFIHYLVRLCVTQTLEAIQH